MAATSCLCGAVSLRNGVQIISVFWILFGIVGFASLFSVTLQHMMDFGLGSIAKFQIFYTVLDFSLQWIMSILLLIATRNTSASNYALKRKFTGYGTFLYYLRYMLIFPYYIIAFIGQIVILSNWSNIERDARNNWNSENDFQDTSDELHQFFINYLIGCIIFLPLETYFLWVVAGYRKQVFQGAYEEHGEETGLSKI